MQEALRRSETLFGSVFDASPAMLALMRVDDTRFVEVNTTFASVPGLDRQQRGRWERLGSMVLRLLKYSRVPQR